MRGKNVPRWHRRIEGQIRFGKIKERIGEHRHQKRDKTALPVTPSELERLPVSLSGQMKRHAPAYVAGAVVLAIFQISMNRIDWLSKSAIDGIFSGDRDVVQLSVVGILGLAVLALVTRVASRWFIFNAGRDVEYELRALLLARLHKLGAAFYRTMSAGEIMSRASGDLLQVRLLAGFGILNLVNVIFAFASALQVMLKVSWKLTLMSLVTFPILTVITRTFSKSLFTRTRENQQALGRLSDVLQTNLSGIRVVRSFALEARELERFRGVNRSYLDASLALARLRGSMAPIVGATASTGVLVFFWYGASLLLKGPANGGISAGDFFAFWMALGRMTWPIIALGFSLAIVQRGRAGYSRLKEIFDAVPEVVDAPKVKLERVTGSLDVTGLSFAYGDHKVLSDVSFSVKAGHSVAIVGRTGAGKSTMALLLARLLPTPPGTVAIDGVDVCDLPLGQVRANIGYAQQDAFLFSTTAARNIGYALDDPDTDDSMIRVKKAAEEAQILDEIGTLPEQFDTVVGERGVQLSGGQKQRIALARALIREPKILVLDDPMSAVDARTEAAILEAIETQKKNRTVVLITHRVQAAKRCDQIIVLDEGKVVECGTHAELLAKSGIYRAFSDEQSAEQDLQSFNDDEAVSA